jgi:hypothetical protein
MHDTLGDNRLARVSVGMVFGATAALLIGMVVVLMAPDGDFADLAAAAVSRAVLVPLGAAIGAVLGYRSSQNHW